jgi:xylulokinase
MTLAAEAAPGSGGVIYLPYLAGEQAPYRDPHARAGWFYVSRKTWRSDLYRAVLEGVAYSMRAIQLLMPAPPAQEPAVPATLRLIGGESCSPLWAQIFADVFDCRVDVLTPADDVAARGAAFLAGRTVGWYSEAVPTYDFIKSQGTYVPDQYHAEIYDRRFEAFCKLYPSLRGLYGEISQDAQ